MRKEYNDRWNAPLVNLGFTIDDNGTMRPIQPSKSKASDLKLNTVPKTPNVFQPTIDGVNADAS